MVDVWLFWVAITQDGANDDFDPQVEEASRENGWWLKIPSQPVEVGSLSHCLQGFTLLGTNISHQKSHLKMIFLSHSGIC